MQARLSRAAGLAFAPATTDRRGPLVGLHGHIHESAGVRRLGRRKSLILNPGSAYSVGALPGALVSLHKDRADAQLVRG